MILVHSFNSSIDITYQIDHLNIGQVHRPNTVIKNAGGKGINVAKVLNQLKENVLLMGYIAGNNGKTIKTKLEEITLSNEFIETDGESRICIAINDGVHQTEILESGPLIKKVYQKEYIHKLKRKQHCNVQVISGSTPILEDATPLEHTHTILNSIESNYNIVDVRASELQQLLQYDEVHCIKPNETEFDELIGFTCEHLEQRIDVLKHNPLFQNKDVFLTLGGNGALIKRNNHLYRAHIPNMQIVNPVGSGDSTVAGIAYGIENLFDDEMMIKFAMACGISNAMNEQTGYISLSQINELIDKIKVEKI